MAKVRNILTFILAITGIGLCVKLCDIYFTVNFDEYALPSFCSINDFVDCDGVAKTSYSQFLGIPLCIWGMFLYLFTILLLFANKLKNIKLFKFLEVFKNPNSYIFVLYSIGFLISMLLAGISFFKIEKICVLCMATYFLDLGIALLNKNYKENLFFELKQSVEDFVSAIKIKKYLISFILVSFIGVAVLTYTTLTNILAPQMKPRAGSVFPQNVKKYNNTIGNPNAKVVIHTYLDYNCQGCFLLDLSLKRILTELDNVLIIHHNFPLDLECNNSIKKGGHKGSCAMARYVLAAKNQGKYWDVNDIFFEQTPKTEKEIKKALKQVKGLKIKEIVKDANSEEIKKELAEELEDVKQNRLDATPTMIINGQKSIGNLPYPELKQKLIELGATEIKQNE